MSKYIIAFVITAGIFISIFFFTDLVNRQRSDDFRATQESLTIDLLSSETQFALLRGSVCDEGGTFSSDIASLDRRLEALEGSVSSPSIELENLQKYYSLLQIKDLILSEEIEKECNQDIVRVIFFTGLECDKCARQRDVLQALQAAHPEVRVYQFNPALDLSVLTTVQNLYEVETTPLLIVDDERFEPLLSLDELEQILGLKAEDRAFDSEAAMNLESADAAVASEKVE